MKNTLTNIIEKDLQKLESSGVTVHKSSPQFFQEVTTPKEEENNTSMEQFVSDYDDYEGEEHDTNLTSHDRAKMYELLRKFRREAIAEERGALFRKWNEYVNENVENNNFNRYWFKAHMKEFLSHLTQE